MSSNNKITPLRNEKPKSGKSVLKFIGFAIVALALLGLVFSSLFSNMGGQTPTNSVFGRYANKKIVYKYNNSFGHAVENELSKYGDRVNQGDQFFDFVRSMAWQQAFNNVTVNTAIAYQLEQSGYEPSSQAIDKRVVEYGPYRTNGKFDESKYRAASDAAKSQDRELFQEQIILETWSQDILDGQYRSDAQLDFLGKMKLSTQSYDYITLPFNNYPEEDIIAYAKENSDLFRLMILSRITVEDEEKANEIVSLFNERQDDIEAFANLAREYSEDSFKDSGGSMGATEYYSLVELMDQDKVDQVFALQKGQIVGPFDTQYGWMILKADEEFESPAPEDSIETVRSYMLQNEVGLIEDTLLTQAKDLRNKAVSADSFVNAMTAEGYEIFSTPDFPFNYATDSLLGTSSENSDNPALSGTASSEEFWTALAPLNRVGEVSRPVILSDSIGIFALKSKTVEETPDNWDSTVDYEIARSRQSDFQNLILNGESKLFVNNFTASYNRFFPNQG